MLGTNIIYVFKCFLPKCLSESANKCDCMTWIPSYNGFEYVTGQNIVWRGSASGKNSTKTLTITDKETAEELIEQLEESIEKGYIE